MRILHVLGRRSTDHLCEVHLAAFGKHRGWDDHIDDLGLDTQPLIFVKRAIYTEGIARNIDAGAWESLDAAKRLERFEHVFAWRSGSDVVVGRMWSSTDGKGRAHYPMVVCAHGVRVALDWAINDGLPQLESLEQRCVAASTAGRVAEAVLTARQALRDRLASSGSGAWDSTLRFNPVERLMQHRDMGGQHEGLLRVLYQIEREMSGYKQVGGHGSTSMKAKGLVARPAHLRVPRCADSPRESILLWMGFLSMQLHDLAPVLILAPLEHEWVDVVVGEPSAAQLFCLRASPQAVPLVTEIPFTLEPDFSHRAWEFIREARTGAGVGFSAGPEIATGRGSLLQRLGAMVPLFRH